MEKRLREDGEDGDVGVGWEEGDGERIVRLFFKNEDQTFKSLAIIFGRNNNQNKLIILVIVCVNDYGRCFSWINDNQNFQNLGCYFF